MSGSANLAKLQKSPKSDDRENIRYSYEDYAAWQLAEGERFELIEGVPYAMAAPNLAHQDIAGEIYSQLRSFLRGRNCRAFIAPVDVCLNAKGNKDKDVVQPDVFVVCDPNKRKTGKYINGVPDFVVEVLSANYRHDMLVKFDKYRKSGVREYWIIDPERKTVQKFILNDGQYYLQANPEDKTKIAIEVLPGCEIDLDLVFEGV
ncbi:MAG: Uma2 family endonuclease [Oscillospiraceae bacterium]|nr:Uma2 family endonuclease [Oscillospiraceae bacterium]